MSKIKGQCDYPMFRDHNINIHKQDNVFTLFSPQNALPLLIDSPHSGRRYPADFNYACDQGILQQTEDNHLDILLENAVNYGATFLQCEFPRCYIDVNRAEDDIDAALMAQSDEKYDLNPTSRSNAGYGLVRRLVRPGLPLYNRLLSYDEIQHRLQHYYLSYHNILQQKLDELHYNFGQVWYLNMHSMPASSAHSEDGHPVDFVLGDRHGTTCRRDFLIEIKNFLEQAGYRVSINDPYKGVELIRRHGRPESAKHALQFEINKNLYWNEITQEFLPSFSRLQNLLNNMIEHISTYIEKELVLKAAD